MRYLHKIMKKNNCLESYVSNLYVTYKYIHDHERDRRTKLLPPSLPILGSNCQTKISVFNASTVIPNPRIQQYDVRRIDGEFKRCAFAVAFRCRSYAPCFATYYLSLPHKPRYIIQLKKNENIYK